MTLAEARITFDRGTITIGAAHLGAISVPGLLWDERVGVYRARAMDHPRIRDALIQAGFGVKDEALASGDCPGEWIGIELRPYQEAALDAWELLGRRGLVILPTGAGKTHVALAAMARARVRTL